MKFAYLRNRIVGAVTVLSLALTPSLFAQGVCGGGASPTQLATQDFTRPARFQGDFNSVATTQGTFPLVQPVQFKGGYLIDAGLRAVIKVTGYNPGAGQLQASVFAVLLSNLVPQDFVDTPDGTWITTTAPSLVTPQDRVLPIPAPAQGIVWDGANIWVSIAGSPNLIKIAVARDAGGHYIGATVVGQYPAAPGAAKLTRLFFDGRFIWAMNASSALVKFDPTSNTGSMLNFNWPLSSMAFDGTYYWLNDSSAGRLAVFDPLKAAIVTIYSNHPNFPSSTIAYDGTSIWMSYPTYTHLAKVRACDGTVDTTDNAAAAVKTGSQTMSFDGTSLYLTYKGSNVVSVR